MDEILYSAKITHTEKTITQLYKMQYYVYDKGRMLLRIVVGFGLVVAAVLLSIPTWAKAILLLLGAWLLVSRDFPATVRADRALSERKAKLPSMEYSFGEDKLHLKGEGSMDIPYRDFTHLIEDDDYLYLFINRNSVCMIDRSSFTPEQYVAFGKFMEEKTGLAWRREKPFLSLSIYDIRRMIQDARGKGHRPRT